MRRVPFSGRRPDPGFPCYYCGVKPDIACEHRPADPEWSMGPEPPAEDGRKNPANHRGGRFRIAAR